MSATECDVRNSDAYRGGDAGIATNPAEGKLKGFQPFFTPSFGFCLNTTLHTHLPHVLYSFTASCPNAKNAQNTYADTGAIHQHA